MYEQNWEKDLVCHHTAPDNYLTQNLLWARFSRELPWQIALWKVRLYVNGVWIVVSLMLSRSWITAVAAEPLTSIGCELFTVLALEKPTEKFEIKESVKQ